MATVTEHRNREHSHLPFLDGVRGLMAFWVLAGHATYVTGLYVPVVSHQQVAVDVFMFVSGFLMAYYFRVREDKEPWDSPASWWTFYIRRFFRIAPAYYLFLLIAFVFRNWFQAGIHELVATYWPAQAAAEPTYLGPLDWRDVLTHLTFTFGFFPQYASSNALSDWSIGLEMQFYLALPFIMLLYRRAGYLISTALLVGICAAAKHLIGVYLLEPPKLLGHFPQPTFLPLRLHHFVIGILLAESYYFKDRDGRKSLLLFLFSAGLAFATSTKILGGTVCLAWLLLVCPVERAPGIVRMVVGWMQSIFDSRANRFFADTSYSVYLLQNLIILPFGAWLILHPSFFPMRAPVRAVAVLVSVGVVVYGLSWLVHHYVERPGIALGRKFVRKRRSTTGTVAGAAFEGKIETPGAVG